MFKFFRFAWADKRTVGVAPRSRPDEDRGVAPSGGADGAGESETPLAEHGRPVGAGTDHLERAAKPGDAEAAHVTAFASEPDAGPLADRNGEEPATPGFSDTRSASAEPVAMGATYRFGRDESRAWFFDGSGLAGAEPFGRWTLGEDASFSFAVAEPPPAGSRLDLEVKAILNEVAPELTVAVQVNDVDAALWHLRLPRGGHVQRRPVPIPEGAVGRDGIVRVRFNVRLPRSPAELGLSRDTRKLGLGLQSLVVSGP